MNTNTIYLSVVVIFMVALMIIGLLISRGVKNTKDWMVAGKSLGIIPMAGTYFATIGVYPGFCVNSKLAQKRAKYFMGRKAGNRPSALTAS